MSSQDSPTLDLDVRSRRIEPLVVCLTLALATLGPFLLQIEPAAQAVLSGVSGLLIAAGFWQTGWWGPRRLEQVVWLSDGRWMLSCRHGPPVEVRLLPDSRRGPGCVWLRWQRERLPGANLDAMSQFRPRSRYTMLLGDGDLPAAQLRRLRVRLAVARTGPRPLTFLEGSNEVLDVGSHAAKIGEYLIRPSVWRALLRRCWSPPMRGAAVAGSEQDCQAVVSGQAARRP